MSGVFIDELLYSQAIVPAMEEPLEPSVPGYLHRSWLYNGAKTPIMHFVVSSIAPAANVMLAATPN